MPTNHQCATCGAALIEGAPDGQCPECLITLGLEAGGKPAPDSDDDHFGELPRQFGDYELLEEIARGGMGVVFKARQKSLDRIVAVKLILAGHFARKDSIQRFRTEASAAAALQHPNIVAIHEVGVQQGEHYLAMDFVDGPDLARFAKNEPMPAHRAARYLKTITEAIQYAHERGILHRDLKPSNVLIDANDQPRVTDFGLAKRIVGTGSTPSDASSEKITGAVERVPADLQLTLSGQVLGSPNYVPPEQASGKRGAISARSDIYSLGAILYHLITGRAPFVSETVTDTLHLVLHEEPASPRLLNPGVSRDLETICLKCLEKDPARRYATAQELADELGRFLRDEPIRARPVSNLYRFGKMVRRNRAVFVIATFLAGTLLLGSIISTREAMRARRAEREQERLRVEAQKAQSHAETQGKIARREAYANAMMLAHESVEQNDLGLARELMEKTRGVSLDAATTNPPSSPQPWEWRHLQFEIRDESSFVLPSQENSIHAIAVSPDDNWLATGTTAGQLTLCTLPARTVQFECFLSNEVACLSFSPDGRQLAAGCLDGSVRLLEIPSGKILATFREEGRMLDLRFSPDGRHLAFAASIGWSIANLDDNTIKRWPRWGQELWRVAIAPDHLLVAEAIVPQGLRFDCASTNAVFTNVLCNQYHGAGAAVSPDGLWFALALADRSIEIWSLKELQPFHRLIGHSGAVETVAWSANSRYLASGADDQRVGIWDVKEGIRLRWLQGHQGGLRAMAFSRDQSTLYTAGSDRTVRIWSNWLAQPLAKSLSFPAQTEARLAPGARFAWGRNISGFETLQIFPLLQTIGSPQVPQHWICGFSPDGALLLGASSRDNQCVIWKQSPTGFIGHPVQHGFENIHGFPTFSSDGSRVALISKDGTLGVFQVEPWRELRQWPKVTTKEHGIVFDPPGNRVFVMRDNQAAVVADVTTGQLTQLPPECLGPGLAISPDNRLVAISNGSGPGVIWAFAPGEEPRKLLTFPGSNAGVWSVAFSPHGSRLAIGLGDGQVHLWDFQHQIKVGVLKGHTQPVWRLGFNSEDESLVSLSAEQVRVWRVTKE